VCGRFLHEHSARADGPYIEVGVGSITRENAAVELFGSEEGGVINYGRLERANNGTLYLDEIADMDPDIQSKLLGVLQSRSFLRVGGSDPVTLDVRIITATQRDLAVAMEEKRFREDLFYQLNVVPLNVPPLRERSEEVTDLLNYYVDYFVQKDNLPYRSFTFAAQNRLRNYQWPGNIRELKNLVQRLLILGTGNEIDVNELESALGGQQRGGEVAAVSGPGFDLDVPLRQARENFEKAYFEHHLQQTGGAVSQVARIAGVERTHLYRKLRALGINPKEDK
jgi:DNA-binding NtrC family response regulator